MINYFPSIPFVHGIRRQNSFGIVLIVWPLVIFKHEYVKCIFVVLEELDDKKLIAAIVIVGFEHDFN